MTDLKYLVTGTGRCGTLYMANLLTSMGFPCSHEAVFTPKGFWWANEVLSGKRPRVSSKISEGKICVAEGEYVAESSYMAAPFLGRTDAEVVHVVRDPMKVVASLVGGEFMQFSGSEPTFFEHDPNHIEYEKFIYVHLPELGRDMSQLDRACLFYVRWNEMIEGSGRVRLFHRIEDGVEDVKELLKFSGNRHYDNKSCNSFPKRRPWSILELRDRGVRKDLEGMAERYGYELY